MVRVDNSNLRRGLIYIDLIIVIVLWGMVPLVMKQTALHMGSGIFNQLRFILSAFVMAAFFWQSIQWRVGRQARQLMLLGAFTLFPFSYFFLIGVKYVDISTAGMIQGTGPALIVIISALYRRVLPTPLSLLSVGLSYGGLWLFLHYQDQTAMQIGTHQMIGIVYLVLAMICFSLYTVISKRISGTINNASVILYASIGATIGAIPFSMSELDHLTMPFLTQKGMWGVSYMAVFATAISFMLYTKSVRIIGSVQAGIFTNFVPIVIVVSGVVALGETLDIMQIIAMTIVLLGIVVSNGESYFQTKPSRH